MRSLCEARGLDGVRARGFPHRDVAMAFAMTTHSSGAQRRRASRAARDPARLRSRAPSRRRGRTSISLAMPRPRRMRSPSAARLPVTVLQQSGFVEQRGGLTGAVE